MSKINIIILLIMLLLTNVGLAAQDQPKEVTVPPFATVEQGTLYLYTPEHDEQAIFEATGFNSMQWNDEGSILAFVTYGDDYQPQLGMFNAATQEVTLFESYLPQAGFPINWTRDGRILFVATDYEGTSPTDMGMKVDFYAIEPHAGAQAELLGSFALMGGCGGGSPFPADWVYTRETGGLGGYHLVLADTPYGIVHSTNCGGTGVGLFDTKSNTDTVLSETLVKVVVSPDRTRVAGLELDYDQYRVVKDIQALDLITMKTIDFLPTEQPDLVAWSGDSRNLYYSTRTPEKDLATLFNAEQKAVLDEAFGFSAYEVLSYNTSIRRINLVSGDDTHLFAGYSYAIGRMIESGGALYFSQVPNQDGWLNALANGEIVYEYDNVSSFVEPWLMRLDVATNPDAMALGMYDQFTPVVIR